MKFLFDLFPIIVFFAVYFLTPSNEADASGNAYIATAAMIAAFVIQFGIMIVRKHKIENMHKINLVLAVVLGGMTILFQNKEFIVWKVTIVNGIIGFVFLASQFFTEKPIVQRLMESQFTVPDRIWARLNLMWVGFFFVMAITNLVVRWTIANFDAWVKFKLFGFLGLMLVFVVLQGLYVSRHIIETESADSTNRSNEE
jgi:intracellular septation protein